MSDSGPLFSYRVVPPTASRPRISTSKQEVTQIAIAYAVLTVDLVIIFTGSTILFGSAGTGFLSALSLVTIGIAALAALTGFVAHELAHKIVAQRRGFWAEFRMSPMGLLISFVTAFVGVLWGAPGATVVNGMPYERTADWGKTSLAGPMTNVAFAGVFYLASIEAYLRVPGTLFEWLLLLAWINGWFGTFNLVPFGPLDGRKVLRWNAGVWAAAIAFTGAFAVVSFLALFDYVNPLFFR